MSWDVREGDCLEVMRGMADASVDAIVCDPPAGIEFMNKEWDSFKQGRLKAYTKQPGGKIAAKAPPGGKLSARLGNLNVSQHANKRCLLCGHYAYSGTPCKCAEPQWAKDTSTRDTFIAFMTEVMREALRVVKPGGHAFVWALPRTSHWTATALEDAGWEIRDVCTHLFASGFPKSRSMQEIDRPELGTALKPASEHWILCRRPLSEPTVAANVLTHGTGALNIDAARIGVDAGDPNHRPGVTETTTPSASMFGLASQRRGSLGSGRWPANAVFSHSELCVPVGVRRVKNDGYRANGSADKGGFFGSLPPRERGPRGIGDADGTEQVERWICQPSCPVAELDRQSGERPGATSNSDSGADSRATYSKGWTGTAKTPGYNDTGGASRFFFVAKSSRSERERGLEHRTTTNVNDGRQTSIDNPYQRGDTQRRNVHPTVKPLDLCDHLIKLVTPPGGTVLDPFCGSGSTGCSAARLGFNFIGIEQDATYCDIARARITFWSDPIKVARYEQEQAAERARVMAEADVAEQGYVMQSLFDDAAAPPAPAEQETWLCDA